MFSIYYNISQLRQQNYMSSQSYQQPFSLEQIKKKLLYDNLLFNQSQIQHSRQQQKYYKNKERQQYSILGYRAKKQLETQQQKEKRKKLQMQNLLKKQYQNQIQIQSRVKTEQKKIDKVYSEMQKHMLQDYQKSRLYDLGKIYHIKSIKKNQYDRHETLQNEENPEAYGKRFATEGCIDSLDQLPKQSQVKYEDQGKYEEQLKPQTPMSMPKSKSSMVNMQYAAYLKEQIQRKQKQKRRKRQIQLLQDKQFIRNEKKVFNQILHQLQQKKIQRRLQFSQGLKQQLNWKKQHNSYFS